MSRTALLIVDHGSKRSEANDMLRQVCQLTRQARPELIVHFAHMSLAEPTLKQGVEQCLAEGATELVIHPYMLSPGRHAMEDIPQMAQAALSGHPHVSCRVTEPLGVDRKIIEVILERAGL